MCTCWYGKSLHLCVFGPHRGVGNGRNVALMPSTRVGKIAVGVGLKRPATFPSRICS